MSMLFPQFAQREKAQPEANLPTTDNWVRGYCVLDEGSTEFDETWPTVFAEIPREGDFIQSNKGNTLKVVRVIHTLNENNQPRIEIELGRERTGDSPSPFG